MRTRTGGSFSRRGFTLVELMVAVAIVGVLASAAMFTYNKWIKKARASEVNEVFSVFRIKQEQHHLETGVFLSTGATEANKYPQSATANKAGSIQDALRPAAWDQLNFDLGKNALWCEYVIIAGNAGGTTGLPFGPLGPSIMGQPDADSMTQDWWYGIAYCPFNKKTYVARMNNDAIIEM